ncbi:MAG TPA: hypothetical protein VFC42_15390 [Methylomirabilota bacterium]|jgi:ElaB/YqjD/DUF883 family membrane-anchored ribosome-binding protein|nr:hypothetical protein [Methylomirabilota bacterium]
MDTEYSRSQGTGTGAGRPGGHEGFGGTPGGTGVGSGIGERAQSVGETAREAYSHASGVVQDARQYVQSAVGQAKEKMAEYREEGWGRLSEDVMEYTRSQPLAALGMAAAIGLVLGWLSAAARR